MRKRLFLSDGLFLLAIQDILRRLKERRLSGGMFRDDIPGFIYRYSTMGQEKYRAEVIALVIINADFYQLGNYADNHKIKSDATN